MVASADSTQTQDITILIVDDDADCRLLIRDAIADCKVTNSIHEAPDGQAALDYLRDPSNPRPGLIYLDIEMPRRDGLATLAAIKSDPSLRDIPVVMMTGVCDEAQMHAAADAGANSYTIKPASAEDFLRTVLTSTNYWLTIHQYPHRHLPPEVARK
jgi:CheY-like chemotaxis protein